MFKTFAFIFLTIFSVCFRAAAQEPVWATTLNDEVEWSQLTSLWSLLVNTGTTVSHIDTESGAVYWQRDTDKELAPYNFHELQGSGYLLIAEQLSIIPAVTELTVLNTQHTS